MDRRTLLATAAAITGGALMPDATPSRTTITDPAELQRQVRTLRSDFARRGALVIGDGEHLADTLGQLEHDRVTHGDVRLADAYAKIGADLCQWLALVHLKAGHPAQAMRWADRAVVTARGIEAWDLVAVAQCRRAGILKSSDPTRAYEVLDAALKLPIGPWAKAFVAQHQAAVLTRYGPEWTPSALGKMDAAERHLNDAIRLHGATKRPWWAGSAERPLSITYTGIDYRRAEIMVASNPKHALKLLDEQVLTDPNVEGFSRAGVQVRQATAAYKLDFCDDAATIALEAWNLLAPAGITRDADRIRTLARLLGQSSDGKAVRDLQAAVA